MKKILLLAAACAAMATAATAQTPAPPAGAGPGQAVGPGYGPPPGGRFDGRRFGRPGARAIGPRLTPEERAKRRADLFAKMDADRNGQVTFEEYRGYIEAQRLERQKRQFERFSGGQSAVTLDQLNARALQRERDLEKRFQDRRGRRGPPPGGPGGV